MKHLFRRIFPVVFIMLFCACGTNKKDEKGRVAVEAAMSNYDRLMVKKDLDSIVLLFRPDGELGNMARGRDSIRKTLGSLKYYKLISQNSISEHVAFDHDTAVQSGLYRQQVVIFGKDSVLLRGFFTTRWVWQDGIGWRIKRLDSKPLK